MGYFARFRKEESNNDGFHATKSFFGICFEATAQRNRSRRVHFHWTNFEMPSIVSLSIHLFCFQLLASVGFRNLHHLSFPQIVPHFSCFHSKPFCESNFQGCALAGAIRCNEIAACTFRTFGWPAKSHKIISQQKLINARRFFRILAVFLN